MSNTPLSVKCTTSLAPSQTLYSPVTGYVRKTGDVVSYLDPLLSRYWLRSENGRGGLVPRPSTLPLLATRYVRKTRERWVWYSWYRISSRWPAVQNNSRYRKLLRAYIPLGNFLDAYFLDVFCAKSQRRFKPGIPSKRCHVG